MGKKILIVEDEDLIAKGSDVMVKTCNRIASIVRGLQMATGHGDKKPPEQVIVQSIVDDVTGVSLNRFKLASINLDSPVVSAELSVFCRPQQVTQILLNLLNNAYDAVAGTDSPWVTISVSEFTENGVSRIRFSVQNSGALISKESRSKLFTPFFTTKPFGKGTGLVLPISRGLAESMGGTLVLVDDTPHTTFCLTLLKVRPATKSKAA
jgi:C4-dicarboxylate-specific signal transduction histidine kinase